MRAKIHCTGLPGPCDRCNGWRKLDCVFLHERKRGRPRTKDDGESLDDVLSIPRGNSSDSSAKKKESATLLSQKPTTARKKSQLCATSDCWAQTDQASSGNVPGLADVAMEEMFKDQAFVQMEGFRSIKVFFELYRNHASNKSCCQAWFNRQLIKLRAMLERVGSKKQVSVLTSWMHRHRLSSDLIVGPQDSSLAGGRASSVVAMPRPPSTQPFEDPDSGFLLPPMTSSKGPMFESVEMDPDYSDSSSTTNESDCVLAPTQSIRDFQLADAGVVKEIDQVRKSTTCAFISVEFNPDETARIETNETFENYFGKSAEYFAKLLQNAYGGLLPWGGDVLCSILKNPSDLMILIRTLAFRFQTMLRMVNDRPVVRSLRTSHIFPCSFFDGSVEDCVIRLFHIEYISHNGVRVSVFACFEPMSVRAAGANPDPLVGGAVDSNPVHTSLPRYSRDATVTTVNNADGPGDATMSQAASSQVAPAAAARIDDDDWIEDLLNWVDDKSLLDNSAF